VLEYTLPDESATFPDLATIFPSANRMQRAAFDLLGVRSDSDDLRPWVWQARWPIDRFPLRRDFESSTAWQPGEEDYPFVRVEGDGVHEIPVGPVHAGIIEPGHFRFQIVGEKVLRLEERLGYVHKGIEKRFEALGLAEAPRLAGRISGDSTVAYACAFAQAVEAIAGVSVRSADRGCACSAWSASASPITSVTSATWATTLALPLASRSSHGSRKTFFGPISPRSGIGC
jgi:hypothetical protein